MNHFKTALKQLALFCEANANECWDTDTWVDKLENILLFDMSFEEQLSFYLHRDYPPAEAAKMVLEDLDVDPITLISDVNNVIEWLDKQQLKHKLTNQSYATLKRLAEEID